MIYLLKTNTIAFGLLFFSFMLNGQAIIADHTIVDDYDIIPQQYIDSVKKMWVTVPGESHSSGYRKGLAFLEDIDSRFQVSVIEFGTPEPVTDVNLRFSRATWGTVTSSSGWMYSYGEEDWFTSQQAVDRTKAGIVYSNENGFTLDAMGFGWCWDMSWNNGPSGEVDPVFQTRWAGTTSGGPQGNLIWGLDDEDGALTGNSVNMHTYINATEEYIQLCEINNYRTKIFFTTGPVDDNSYNTGERGYQRFIKTEYIRDYVNSRGNGYLFDYADIVSWSNDGEYNTISWTDYGGTLQNFEFIHPENMLDMDGGFKYDGDHIGEIGTIRLAKAMWWMLARMAGWDGLPEGQEDAEAPSVPSALGASVQSVNSVSLHWTASLDNVGVTGYTIFRDGLQIGTTANPLFQDSGLEGAITYSYEVRAYDAAGNVSQSSDPLLINIYDSLGMGTLTCSLQEGYNWFSMNLIEGDMSLESVFPLLNQGGNYIKSQTESASFYDGYGWFGTLNRMDPRQLYLLKVNEACDVNLSGYMVDPDTSDILLYTGWNWIGYLPQQSFPIEEALASLDFTDNDYIKDQTSSATYYTGTGWFGSLTDLLPGNGYMMKIANSGTLTYPGNGIGSQKKGHTNTVSEIFNEFVSPYDYEFNATITARVEGTNNLDVSETDILLAYVGEDCRGAMNAMYFTPDESMLFPLMMYSNMPENEIVTFRYFNAETQKYYDCNESVNFQKDTIIADAYMPFVLTLKEDAVAIINSEIEAGFYLDVYPNPFSEQISISYSIGKNADVLLQIFDMSGRILESVSRTGSMNVTNKFEWNAAGISSGTYYVKLTSDQHSIIKRILHL